jgi:LPS-assembly lipoprotein
MREKVVVGRTSTGAVRENQLRLRVRFRVRNREGIERIPETELVQVRDITFNESYVLAKTAEETLLYANMQTDMIQQILRRLAALQQI